MTEARVRALDARWEVFTPLGGPRADAIVGRLTEAITLGLLTDGEQLPSEVVMAQRLGVSTLTLREALAELRRQGLVETRRGRGGGSFVQTRGGLVTRLTDQLLHTTPSELRDRGDEHGAVAGAAAGLAAQRADEDDVQRLRHLLAAQDWAIDAEQARRADNRLHIDIAVASQSIRLTRAAVRLQGEVGALLWLVAGDGWDVSDAVARYRHLVDAIAAGDVTTAVALAHEHVAQTTRALTATHLRLTR